MRCCLKTTVLGSLEVVSLANVLQTASRAHRKDTNMQILAQAEETSLKGVNFNGFRKLLHDQHTAAA